MPTVQLLMRKDLQTPINLVYDGSCRGPNINKSKTKWMAIGKMHTGRLLLNGAVINQVQLLNIWKVGSKFTVTLKRKFHH